MDSLITHVMHGRKVVGFTINAFEEPAVVHHIEATVGDHVLNLYAVVSHYNERCRFLRMRSWA